MFKETNILSFNIIASKQSTSAAIHRFHLHCQFWNPTWKSFSVSDSRAFCAGSQQWCYNGNPWAAFSALRRGGSSQVLNLAKRACAELIQMFGKKIHDRGELMVTGGGIVVVKHPFLRAPQSSLKDSKTWPQKYRLTVWPSGTNSECTIRRMSKK